MHRVCAPCTYSHWLYAIRIFLPVDMWRLSSAMMNSHCWFTSKNWLTASDTIQSKCIMQFIVLQLMENSSFFPSEKEKYFPMTNSIQTLSSLPRQSHRQAFCDHILSDLFFMPRLVIVGWGLADLKRTHAMISLFSTKMLILAPRSALHRRYFSTKC